MFHNADNKDEHSKKCTDIASVSLSLQTFDVCDSAKVREQRSLHLVR